MKINELINLYVESLPSRVPLIARGNGDDLSTKRCLIFNALRKRIMRLKAQNPPASYYIGKEYVEDERRYKATIGCTFEFPAIIDGFSFWHNGTMVSVHQQNGSLLILVEREISSRLWDDMRLLGRGDNHIVAIFASFLHKINRRILYERYSGSHLLARTASIFELQNIRVICRGRVLPIAWPIAFLPHPGSVENTIDDIYFRDYIDAFGCYFRNEYDECIRKIVTSAEGFMRERRWKSDPGSFRNLLKNNLNLATISGEVINFNLRDIYRVRNKIVHDGFHMSMRSTVYCNKALATLKYLIYRYSGYQRKSTYAYELHRQFIQQCSALGEHQDLDEIASTFGISIDQDRPTINSPSDLEFYMFSSLRYTISDKTSILK